MRIISKEGPYFGAVPTGMEGEKREHLSCLSDSPMLSIPLLTTAQPEPGWMLLLHLLSAGLFWSSWKTQREEHFLLLKNILVRYWNLYPGSHWPQAKF